MFLALLSVLCVILYFTPLTYFFFRVYSLCLNIAVMADLLLQEELRRDLLILAAVMPTLWCVEVAC
jgi:hypothetical protein